jgi:filamentous hemagglutinin family protein
MTTTTLKRKFGALLLAACYSVHLGAQGAPTLPQVTAGQASFSQQGNVFSITNTPGTIINWQSFNIGAGEITRFIQQGSDSAVLNRVLGQDPSKILGALQSNGKVFLINPNGILFGQGARVDVNGLVASTLNLSDADFLAGKKNFTAGANGAAAVRNDGSITTPTGGKVFLVATNVENNGIIRAPNGEVVLAAGHSVQLVDSSDPDLHVVVSAPDDQALNLGSIVAQGGRIGIYGALLNQRGVVNADSALVGENGKIVLKASRATVLEAGSVTSATGAGQGGEIRVLGDSVSLTGGASVDASGQLGGGTVLVGGDYQGGNSEGGNGVQRARQATLAAGASIRADALQSGNGGKVVLWSDGATAAHGSISARGAGSGNGGLVETSGHGLDIAGLRVNAGAVQGKSGTWLLDPYDLEVGSGGASANPDQLTRVSAATLTAADADIVLQAQHDLTISENIETRHNVTAQAGNDLAVNAKVATSAGNIDLRAGNQFTLGASGALLAGNYIDLRANGVTLNGYIGAVAGGPLPILTFTSSDAARPIVLGSGNVESGSLWLDAPTLARWSSGLYEINIGNSRHTGAISVTGAFTGGTNLVLENAGKIYLDAAIDLSSSPDSRFVASLYGGSTGLIQVGAPLKAAKSILLQGDRVWLDDTVTVTDGGVSLMPNNTDTEMHVGGSGNEVGFSISQEAIERVRARELTIGGLDGHTAGLTVDGAVTLAPGTGTAATLRLDAGAGLLALQAPVSTPGTLALASSLGIFQEDEGVISAAGLALRGGPVVLGAANTIGTLAASGSASVVQVTSAGALIVGTVDGLSGIAANGSTLQLTAGGALSLEQGISGAAYAGLQAAGITGGGVLEAGTLSLRSSAGIGSATAPLKTRSNALMAYNSNAGSGTGGQPINIANQGELVLISAVQDGAANTGSIAIDSIGGMIVPQYMAGEDGSAATGEVRTGSGDISLATHSPMTVQGRVTTTSGNVRLLADNGGELTIAEGARVASGSGEVRIDAGSANIASGAIQVSSQDKLHVTTATSGDEQVPPPVPVPSLESCVATPAAGGCADVLAKALLACVADQAAPFCAQVLPPLATCQADASTPGCGVVLARYELDQCVANPKLPGCEARLPAYEVCAAAPSTYGCAPVIQQRDAVTACIADPKAAGCGATLPALDTCRANPGVYGCVPVLARAQFEACLATPAAAGCAAVLPSVAVCKATPGVEGCSVVLGRYELDQCVANPKLAGCEARLPAYEVCAAAPSTYGCAPVIQQRDAVSACIADPKAAGCGATLPALDTCRANPGVYGCVPVLARAQFEACLATPAAAGCAAVLPSLAVCKVTPGVEGCSQVLALGFQACLAHPQDASCSGILPTIVQCVANTAQPGCEVVLPTLAQCIGSPSLQGCEVRLPSLAQCAQSPSLAGCEAVLPTASFCAAHPGDASCVIFSASGSSQDGQTTKVAQAVQSVVQLIATGIPDAVVIDAERGSNGTEENTEGKRASGAVQEQQTGVTNEKRAIKNYCN